MKKIVVIAFYKFVPIDDPESLRDRLLLAGRETGLLGTILLAEEGINGMLAGSRESIDAFVADLRNDDAFSDLERKESFADDMPFEKLKVKVKPEIVALKVEGVDPNARVGAYVDPQDWNALIQDPDVRVIDTRNHFEFELGTFKGAEDPNTKSFRNFPDYVARDLDPSRDKKVAMFCTGGIRCEKATSFLLQQGFDEVFHLRGGILKYLEEVDPEDSLWEGECFVFDDRIAVDHQLNPNPKSVEGAT